VPAHPAPRRSRVPAAGRVACRSGGRPVPLWSRARCNACRSAPGRRCLLVRTAIPPPGPGPAVVPLAWAGRSVAKEPDRSAAPLPARSAAAAVRAARRSTGTLLARSARSTAATGGRSPAVGQADRSGRAPEADRSQAASGARQAGGPVPVLVPLAFPGRSRAAPRPGRASRRNPRAAEADLPDSRAGPPSRRAGEVRSLDTRAGRQAQSRRWGVRADRPGAATAPAPSPRSAARPPNRCRLPPRAARLPPPHDGAPRGRPGSGWRRSARAGRGRRRCRARATRAGVDPDRPPRHLPPPHATEGG